MSFTIFESILIVLAIAVAVNAVFHRFNLPVTLGYILIGVAVGPNGLGWVPSIQAIRDLAEFGVVFLMFTVGLQFSLSKLIELRKVVFLFGGLQIVLSIVITTLLCEFFNMG